MHQSVSFCNLSPFLSTSVRSWPMSLEIFHALSRNLVPTAMSFGAMTSACEKAGVGVGRQFFWWLVELWQHISGWSRCWETSFCDAEVVFRGIWVYFGSCSLFSRLKLLFCFFWVDNMQRLKNVEGILLGFGVAFAEWHGDIFAAKQHHRIQLGGSLCKMLVKLSS